MRKLEKVAITGASSGIGEALAWALAKEGASIALLARREDRLTALAASLTECYPEQKFVVKTLDVAVTSSILPVLEKARDELGGLDTVIANAGITAVNATGKGDFGKDARVLQINLLGGMATCDAAARLLREQGGGHIAGISSIVAFQGIPGSAAYSASKAGFGHYLATIGMELRKHGIEVTAIYPGFIQTELVPHMEKMPFVVGAEKAAASMVKAIQQGRKKLIVPAWPWRLMVPFLRLLPESVIVKSLR
jgi:short-subunit dehydrogenase